MLKHARAMRTVLAMNWTFMLDKPIKVQAVLKDCKHNIAGSRVGPTRRDHAHCHHGTISYCSKRTAIRSHEKHHP